jgi:hypothetical protein
VAEISPRVVLDTIHRGVRDLDLPAPTGWSISTPTALDIVLASPSDVDRWARHIGSPPGRPHVGSHRSVDFRPEPGWLGATTVILSCPLPLTTTARES